jgi:hypothetical protein
MRLAVTLSIAVLLAAAWGCGTLNKREATEQLLASDAVDRAVADIDFRVLSKQKVYLDTLYIRNIKGLGFVNAEYIISSLRQQITAAGCMLQEKESDADYIVEARVGALGIDSHDITYGVPSSTLASSAATLIPSAPAVPAIPELSVAKRNDELGAAKIACFAYRSEDRAPVWQSGVSKAKSNTRAFWILGAGPFQYGTINEGAELAGETIGLPEDEEGPVSAPVSYHQSRTFGGAPSARRRDRIADIEAAGAKESVKQVDFQKEASAPKPPAEVQPEPAPEAD